MKKLIVLLFLISTFNSFSQTTEKEDKDAIMAVLKAQRLAWSKNNIAEYMEGYWKSDSL